MNETRVQSGRDKDLILRRVNHWVESVVIALGLCPFAGAVYRSGLLQISVVESTQLEHCLQNLAVAAEQLAEADPRKTTLLVIPEGFDNFDDYLDLLALGEALLSDRGFDGLLQLASFHPQYRFADSPTDDPGNWTNRSPYPILHLLTEASVSDAIKAHPDPDSIPQANIQRLSRIGIDGIKALFAD